MGCGQSKIHLYPRKSKSKANGKKGGHADSDAETDEDEGHIEDAEKAQTREHEKHDESEEQSNKELEDGQEDVAVSLLRAKNLSLLQSQEISSSQQNFFRMLDKKIDEGPDYDSASETEIALEEARLNALVQHWESASLTASICSSASRSLQTTPIRQVQVAPLKQLTSAVRSGPSAAGHLLQPSSAAAAQLLTTCTSVAGGTLPTTDYLPQHVLAGRHLQQQQQQHQQQQQQQQQMMQSSSGMLLTHMSSQLLPLGDASGSSLSTVNTSNSAAAAQLAQLQQQHQQQQQQLAAYGTHLLALPAGSSGAALMGKPQNVSPKRLLMTTAGAVYASPPVSNVNVPTQLQATQQQQQQQQYISTSSLMQPGATGFINGGSGGVGSVGGGRSPQPLQTPSSLAMQMAYYGPTSTAPSTQAAGSGQTAPPPHVAQQQLQLEHDPYPYESLTAPHSQSQQSQQQQQQSLTSQQPPPGAYYGDVMHGMQAAPPTEYKFPPAISVQRLAPQVQRQLRETQELIKDSCPQLYAAGYGSPGPPIRNPNRNPTRTRPTLETQFSQELS